MNTRITAWGILFEDLRYGFYIGCFICYSYFYIVHVESFFYSQQLLPVHCCNDYHWFHCYRHSKSNWPDCDWQYKQSAFQYITIVGAWFYRTTGEKPYIICVIDGSIYILILKVARVVIYYNSMISFYFWQLDLYQVIWKRPCNEYCVQKFTKWCTIDVEIFGHQQSVLLVARY